ncbi:MAG: GNAT family N-acetyltransferase [Saprospiraceae bacterium]
MNKIPGNHFSWISSRCADVAALTFPCNGEMAGSPERATFSFGPWEAVYADSFGEVAQGWPSHTGNSLLSTEYLRAMEEGLPPSVRQRYLLLYGKTGIEACLVFQVVDFRALEDIRAPEVWSGLWGKFKRFAARIGNFRLLICGNLFMVGENGLYARDKPTERQVFQELKALMQILARKEKAQVLVCKDFEAPQAMMKGFHALHFQPAMCLEIRPDWKSFEDYLAPMGSKYRVRARRAFRKGAGIRYEQFSLEMIEQHAQVISAMYQGIVKSSGFSLATVGPEYFIAMKRRLRDAFALTACYDGERLCGFYCTIRNGLVLEANFVGFLPEYNHSAQLYLNMLYRMVEEAIQGNLQRVAFSRTALEIKSSVGARPVAALVYMAHTNPLLHVALPPAVRFLEPREEWVERHVFHEAT